MHCTGCPHSLFEQRVRLACGTRTRNAVLHNCNPLRQQQRHTSRRVGRKAGIQERPTELPSVNQQLLQWLVANGVVGVGHEDSHLGIYQEENGQRGLLFVKDVSENTLLLSIPLRLAITDRVPGSDSDPGQDLPSDIRLASNLVREVKLGTSSAWYPYIQTLPKDVSSMYGTWSDSATDELQLEAVPRDMQYALRAGRTKGSGNDLLKWALSMVHSRSFALPGGGKNRLATRCFLPFADLLNHGGDVAEFLLNGRSQSLENIRWAIVPDESSQGLLFQCYTVTSVEEGEEALVSYGNRSSWKFLLFYGFVPIRNVHDHVILFQSLAEAVDWFLDRFPPKGDVEERRKKAIIAASASAAPLAKVLENDAVAAIQHEAIIATANMGGDARLWDAFNFLVQSDDLDYGRSHARGKTDRIVALRAAEILLAPKATSLLADLKDLATSDFEDEYDKAYHHALGKHYEKVISEFETEFSGFLAMAKSLQPEIGSPVLPRPAGLSRDECSHQALRLRSSNKQVLWELMTSLLG